LRIHVLRILAFVLVCVAAVPCRAQDKVTILYDAFGESKELTKDWGFSALVEHNGERILFDTGNNAANLEHNVAALGVELTKLDFVVISHRHTDHTTGLRYVLSVNPNVTVYVPADGANGPLWTTAFHGAPGKPTNLDLAHRNVRTRKNVTNGYTYK
jgi:7,8-dihydropterin-6-yl-methyl-4-(beta-D-ribofuranosyl)aminobenzene 5'-phosphate synthase